VQALPRVVQLLGDEERWSWRAAAWRARAPPRSWTHSRFSHAYTPSLRTSGTPSWRFQPPRRDQPTGAPRLFPCPPLPLPPAWPPAGSGPRRPCSTPSGVGACEGGEPMPRRWRSGSSACSLSPRLAAG
jgi:hypothetical protein